MKVIRQSLHFYDTSVFPPSDMRISIQVYIRRSQTDNDMSPHVSDEITVLFFKLRLPSIVSLLILVVFFVLPSSFSLFYQSQTSKR